MILQASRYLQEAQDLVTQDSRLELIDKGNEKRLRVTYDGFKFEGGDASN